MNQPAERCWTMQEVTNQIPGQRADQVQIGWGKGSGQDGQACLQTGHCCCVISLQKWAVRTNSKLKLRVIIMTKLLIWTMQKLKKERQQTDNLYIYKYKEIFGFSKHILNILSMFFFGFV